MIDIFIKEYDIRMIIQTDLPLLGKILEQFKTSISLSIDIILLLMSRNPLMT